MRERVRREELATRHSQIEMEYAQAKAEREVLREERDREMESAANLHAVLEEFQAGASRRCERREEADRFDFAAKDNELQALLGDLQTQLHETQQALEGYRRRATQAETQLQNAQNDSEKVLVLAQEVKEKNLLIGKLRHEGTLPRVSSRLYYADSSLPQPSS